jgi:hypothetical protein
MPDNIGTSVTQFVENQLATGQNGWTAETLSPGNLPVPQAFITPESVVADVQRAGPTTRRTFSPADFMTQPAALNDPALASRGFNSTPTTAPLTVGASVSAFNNFPAPAFLTDAVNRLNTTQSLRAMEQADFRQQLLDATLSGNFLAAEALRASAVQPGTSVGFGSAVLDPQIGQAALTQSEAAAHESSVRTSALQSATSQEEALRAQLMDVQRDIARVTPAGGQFGGSIIGSQGQSQERFQLQSQQRRIQRELERQQANLAQGGAFRPSGFSSPPIVIGI